MISLAHAGMLLIMGFILQIKVIPNAKKNEIVSSEEGSLKIRIKGVPEKGKVNLELRKFLAKEYGVAPSDVKIISGMTSRIKKVKIG